MATSLGARSPRRRHGHQRGQAVTSITPIALEDLASQVKWQETSSNALAFPPKTAKMPEGKGKKIPKPGPAKLSKDGQNNIDEWLKCAFNNHYLPEATMKKLCEICKEYLMEGNWIKLLLIDLPWLTLAPMQSPTSNRSPLLSPSAAISTANSTMSLSCFAWQEVLQAMYALSLHLPQRVSSRQTISSHQPRSPTQSLKRRFARMTRRV